MRAQPGILTAERLRSLLSYVPETGEFLWLVNIGSRAQTGAIAGTVKAKERRRIRIDNRSYLASRLAWLYMTGAWPAGLVDHENRIKSDDRWANLRDATPSQNNANSTKRDRNTSGFKGVTWDRKRQKWQAQLAVRGKNIYLGLFESAPQASEAYKTAARQHFGEFAHA